MFNRLKVLKAMSALSAVVFVMGCAGSSRGPSTVSPQPDGGYAAQETEQRFAATQEANGGMSDAPMETQTSKQSVAIYMAGTEPSALKGAHKVIGSELAKALSESHAYSAIDRTQEVLNIIEDEHVYQRSGAVDDEQIKELGKQLGVRFLCIAEVNEVMGSYLLDARLVDVETARVLKVVSKPGSMRDIYQLVEISQSAAKELTQRDKR